MPGMTRQFPIVEVQRSEFGRGRRAYGVFQWQSDRLNRVHFLDPLSRDEKGSDLELAGQRLAIRVAEIIRLIDVVQELPFEIPARARRH
jgi:hypothetical protein